jgi:hypothetical protein
MGVRGNLSIKGDPPPGRGFLVRSIQATLVQMCAPVVDGRDGRSPEDELAAMIADIRRAYRTRARWSYHAQDLAALEKAIATAVPQDEDEDLPPSSPPPSAAAPVPTPEESETMAELSKLMAMQAGMTEQIMASDIPEAGTFASVSVEDEAKSSGKKEGGDGAKKSRKKKG